jgi:hypothetical protein
MRSGERFKQAVIRFIKSWNTEIELLEEKPVGYRFINNPRNMDIVLRNGGKYLGIEAKVQTSSGTAYQKLSYALDDCKNAPIPTIIVFADTGNHINPDMKSKLIMSGIGIEVNYVQGENAKDDYIIDNKCLFQQRVYIELGLDWFSLY